MQATYLKKGINLNLEALRGYAALFVVLNHIEALNTVFDSKYLPKLTVLLAPNGHLFVLVFFVLSGYVIAVSNQRLVARGDATQYLKKRLLRIYPIYFIAMLFTLIIANTHYSVVDIVCNFLLAQALIVPVFAENGPAWSLNFEIIYYLLFVPISYFRLRPLPILLVSLLIAILKVPLIAPYCLGFAFWMGGLCIARYFKDQQASIGINKLVSALFMLLAIDQLASRSGLPQALAQLNILPDNVMAWQGKFIFNPLFNATADLFFLPYFLYFVLLFSGRRFKYQKLVWLILQLPLVYSIGATAIKFHADHVTTGLAAYGISVGYYLISLLLWFASPGFAKGINQYIINLGSWLGGVSYGLYIIHAPLLNLAGRISFVDNAPLNYTIKFIVFITVAIIAAYFLEKKMQPLFKKMIMPRNKNAVS